MPCCGSNRTGQGHSASLDEEVGISSSSPSVMFVYVGRSTLNVIGGATGRQYRFDGPGSRLAVDRRDAPGLSAVPKLRRP
jgi:hypothetical protein